MSQKLFDRNADLRKLREEGYAVQMRGGFLLMRVPHVGPNGEVRLGSLISSLTLAGDVTQRPDNHVVHWDGDYPCNIDGKEIEALRHASGAFDLALWLFSALFALFSVLCSIKSATERATQAWLDHKKARRRRRQLAAAKADAALATAAARG